MFLKTALTERPLLHTYLPYLPTQTVLTYVVGTLGSGHRIDVASFGVLVSGFYRSLIYALVHPPPPPPSKNETQNSQKRKKQVPDVLELVATSSLVIQRDKSPTSTSFEIVYPTNNLISPLAAHPSHRPPAPWPPSAGAAVLLNKTLHRILTPAILARLPSGTATCRRVTCEATGSKFVCRHPFPLVRPWLVTILIDTPIAGIISSAE